MTLLTPKEKARLLASLQSSLIASGAVVQQGSHKVRTGLALGHSPRSAAVPSAAVSPVRRKGEQ